MLVGAGIGVTPFASILKHIKNVLQRQTNYTANAKAPIDKVYLKKGKERIKENQNKKINNNNKKKRKSHEAHQKRLVEETNYTANAKAPIDKVHLKMEKRKQENRKRSK